ncbi:hypothetical protein [uncultured Agrobacterium sp.]|uniref:hypothetical protein n=1 Tax=uncultured Agrobacterium sp. TaxID=157277 RepID=UPI0025CCC2AC|nr:hypothetical protein [uncultured Agrobacterium sp.]
MITVRLSIVEDVRYLASRLRKEDLDEVLAGGGVSAEQSLMDGLNSSDVCLTGVNEHGLPMLMFGTVPHPSDPLVGGVWLLASDEVLKHRTDFLRKSREYMDIFQRKYPVLMNFTDCRNSVHHRWLRWCRFNFINIVNGLGPGDHPFYEVVRIGTPDV